MSNLWQKFQQLIPQTPLMIVTVETINPDGTSRVTSSNGDLFLVRGVSVPVGAKAFIKDGVIQGEAPLFVPVDQAV